MGAAQTIRERRIRLGMSDVEVAKRTGLNIHEYGDIEQHADELETAVSLGTARRLCEILGLSLHEVLNIPLDQHAIVTNEIDSNERLKSRREMCGLSRTQLADQIGFEEATIASLEEDCFFANTLPISVLSDLEMVLNLPRGTLFL